MLSDHNKYVLARWLVKHNASITKSDSFGRMYITVDRCGRSDDEVYALGREFQVLCTIASHYGGFACTPGVFIRIKGRTKDDTTV